SGGYRSAPIPQHAQLRALGKLSQHTLEQAPAVNGRAEIAHVAAEHGIEVGQEVFAAPADREAVPLPLTNLVTNLRRQLTPEHFGRVRQCDAHMNLGNDRWGEARFREGLLMSELEVTDIELIGQ